MNSNTSCPCGSNKEYSNCCERIHKDIFKAKTAEQLMRSRYTAFTLGDVDYLMDSQHSTTRDTEDKTEIENWAKSVRWIKLEILNSTQGQDTDEQGTVEFRAHFEEEGKRDQIHENSTFCKENGHWVYVGAH